MTPSADRGPPKVPFWYDPKIRAVTFQTVLCATVALVAFALAHNAAENLARAKVASGFSFWEVVAGFDISQTLISYSAESSTYGRAFWVGLLNTLLVAVIGIVLATILGFVIGIGRLSHNWLVARLAGGYVESIRNVPLLLQLLFWYNAVLKTLPEIRDSIHLPGGGFLNNRGLFIARPEFESGFRIVELSFVGGIAAAVVLTVATRMWLARKIPVSLFVVLFVLGVPLLVFVAVGRPISFVFPQMGRFNIRDGIEILPEFVALVFGLVVYTAAFIAEVVRAGILSVPKGQVEAAHALGLRPLATLRLVVVPQAMRVIIPPLTNQYLNLTKNSSLAVAIGYPDLVQIFAGTVLNQTGQAVEVVAVTMAVYLAISLITSMAMNLYNARFASVQR